MPAASARRRSAVPSGRRLRWAARHGRPAPCSVNRTLAAGVAAGERCYARGQAGARVRVRTRGKSCGGQGGTPGAPDGTVKAVCASAPAAPGGQRLTAHVLRFIAEREPERQP